MRKDSDILEALKRAYFLIETHNIEDAYFDSLREEIKDILPSQICGLEFFIKTGKVTMTVTEALQLIERNKGLPALNYCINYAHYALALLKTEDILKAQSITGIHAVRDKLKVQLLYVLNNMIHWRQCKASTTTAAEIKECRTTLKKASV